MPFALARSAIDIKLSSIIWGVKRAGVSGYVVCAGQNDNYFGLEGDDVGAKADEHLGRSLAADSAVHVRFAGEKLSGAAAPGIGDGITHEDDNGHRQRVGAALRFPPDNVRGSASPVSQLQNSLKAKERNKRREDCFKKG